MMKPEQQRIAIAEACGYYLDTEKSDESLWWLCRKEQSNGVGDCKSNKRMCWEYAPNYLNDLNAMHEAEKILIRPNLYAKGGWGTYLRHLSIVTDEQHPIDATAAQRAEAFLRAIGKWEGE